MKTALRPHLFAFPSRAAFGPNRHSNIRVCAGVLFALALSLLSVMRANAGIFTLGTTNLLEGPAAGSDSVILAAPSSTNAWTASTNATWLHLSAANQSGIGSENVVFSFDANAGATRAGTLTIAGLTLTVTQAGSTYSTYVYNPSSPGPEASLVSSNLNSPYGVALDGAGNVYICNSGNATIEKWSVANNTANVIISSGLQAPLGIAADNAGNIYIADNGSDSVKKWTAATSNLTTLVSSSYLGGPQGVAVDTAGNVYIADTTNNAVVKWTAATSNVTTLVSSGLSSPRAVAVDVSSNVYIIGAAGRGSSSLMEWSPANGTLTTLVSSGLNQARSIAVDGSGDVFIANSGGNTISEWVAASGTVITAFSYGLSAPDGVAVDPRNIYFSNSGNEAVEELPYAFLDPTPKSETYAAGTDVLPVVLPTTTDLSGPFAPISSQPWLTISVTNDIVGFTFAANSALTNRTAQVTLLGQTITITQTATNCPIITVNPTSLANSTEDVFYSQAITASGASGPFSFVITSGTQPPGLNLSSTGTLSGTPTTPGITTFTVTAINTNGCTGSQTYTITNSCATITLSPTLPAGTVGVSYNQTITASGGSGPYTFTKISKVQVPGLTLSSSGTLSGTPTTSGTTGLTVMATDTNGCTGIQSYMLVINCPNITLNPTSLPNGTEGVFYSQTISASGGSGPYNFTLVPGSQPPGLTLSTSGTLTGAPTTPGTTIFTVTATDTNGCAGSADITLTVTTNNPLTLLSTYILCDDTNLIAAFSNPLASGVATNVSDFHVSLGGETFNVVASAQLGDDAQLLKITLPVSPEDLGVNYVLSMTGVMDVFGNTYTQTNVPIICATNICQYASSGTQFWLTFPGNYAPDPNNPPAVELYITGLPGVVGAVSIPGFSPPFVSSFTIPAGGTVPVALPSTADLGNANDVVETNGIDVVASQPVTVDAFDHVPYTSDAYLGLPTHTLGASYVVMAYKNVYTGIPDLNGSQFAIVATANNTTVTIVPPVQVGAHPANTPFNVNLMQGQTYQLRDTNDAPADLTGTTIDSTQPIALFSGHECASVPVADDFFCDYLVQQLLPVTLWGNNFLTVPFATRLNGDTFRCLAWQPNTLVYTNGILAGTINAGQFLEFQLQIASHITSTAPILVAQFADSSDYDNVVDADPLMCLIPPTTLYANGYQVVIPTESYFPSTGNYLNILTPTNSIVDLDGTAVPGPFTPLGGTIYSWAQVPVNPGTHTIISAGGEPIGVTAYGWAQYDAYGYPAGICSQTNGATPQFTCPTNLIQFTVPSSNSMVAVPDLTNQVGNAGSAMSITQTPPPGTLVGPGPHQISITIIDQFGQSHLCQSMLIVFVQNPAVISASSSSFGVITLKWTDNAILQGSISPAGPWTNITTATSPYIVTPVYKQYFYRTVLP